jgi:hypothetical protein
MTLRERVTRLESLLETVLPMTPGQNFQDASTLNSPPSALEASDIEVPASGTDPQAPFLSMLGEAEVNSFLCLINLSSETDLLRCC